MKGVFFCILLSAVDAHRHCPLFVIVGKGHLVCWQRRQPDSAGPTEVQIIDARRDHNRYQHVWPVQVEAWRAGV